MGRLLQMAILLLLAAVEASEPFSGTTNGKLSKSDVEARKEAQSRLLAKLSELGFESPFPSKGKKATVPSKLPSQRIPRLIHQTYKSHESLSPELWASIDAVKRANPESVQSIILLDFSKITRFDCLIRCDQDLHPGYGGSEMVIQAQARSF
jgi:mannosyltransferase OCH1-like enzyme